MSVYPSWAHVYAEQYRFDDIRRDMKRIHLAEKATRGEGRSEPSKSRYVTALSMAFLLLSHILPHVGRS